MSANQQIAFENLVTQHVEKTGKTRQQAIYALMTSGITPESMPR